jgi:UDP-glucose 4-epimerase
MLGRGGTITLNGDDYETPDGTCIRDYIHVGDLCEAHLLGLEQVLREPGLYQYNLGNGTGFSIKEVFSATQRVIQRPIQYQVAGRRLGDPPRLVADSSKARTQLKWRPKHPSLDQIILSAWRWHSQRLF